MYQTRSGLQIIKMPYDFLNQLLKSNRIKWIRYVIGSFRRGAFWPSAKRWLRNNRFPFPMSWQSYAFDDYLRRRHSTVPAAKFYTFAWIEKKGVVSIILPVYNGEKYLTEALDSILRQDYISWELIAVDDGSTDNSGRILDHYSNLDTRVHVIHQSNKKLPGALNAGFALACGEFCTWISCDNVFYPNFLSKMVSCLVRHQNWDMSYANFDLIDEYSQPLINSPEYVGYQHPFGSQHINLPLDSSELNTFPNNTVGPAFIFRKRVLGLLGFFSTNRFTLEDYDYWMRINEVLVLRHTDFLDSVVQYRFHGDSLTSHKEDLKIIEKRVNLMIYDDFRRDFNLTPLLWTIETDHTSKASDLANKLTRILKEKSNLIIQIENIHKYQLAKVLTPVIYLKVISQPCREKKLIPPDLEQNIYKILVLYDFSGVESLHLDDWDCSLLITESISNSSFAPFIETQNKKIVLIEDDQTAIFSISDILARSFHQQIFEKEVFMYSQPSLQFSIVVCVHQIQPQIQYCLEALFHQTYSSTNFEVILVNNAPELHELNDYIDEVLSQLSSESEVNIKRIDCPIHGLSFARNAGLCEATGEIICFIDDDAIADSEWLQQLSTAYRNNPQVSIIGGKIILKKPDKVPFWLRSGFQRFWGHFEPTCKEFYLVAKWQDFPWGGNWSAKRNLLLEIGGFRTRYGRMGKNLRGGEEIVAASLAQQIGYGIGITPEAVVYHHVDPKRFTLINMWRTAYSARRTWYQMQKDNYLPFETSPKEILSRIINSLKSFKSDTFFKFIFTLLGETQLITWLVIDTIKRFRQPIKP